MDLRRWPDADRLIEEALALAPGARRAFVQDRTAGDAALRAAIEAVLVEAECEDDFLKPGDLLSGRLAADLALQPDADERPLLPAGSRFAGYEVLGLAGRGGMGEVYRARDPRLGRTVALKILPDRFARDTERLARFEREARVLASLNHPRIGGIHGIAEEGDTGALVLEWVDGPTLADRLARGPLPAAEALLLACQLGEALEAAHQRAIVHRDLKPANIKLTADGVKVLDFGLARAAGADESAGREPISTVHMRPGLVLGTPSYMSPEAAQGLRVDHRADIWAFGCILAEMLTGRRVFSGPTPSSVVQRVIEAPADLTGLPPSLSEGVRGLILRCLEKDPRRRTGWIGEIVLALEETRRPAPPPPPFAALRRWWSRGWPAAGGLAAGTLAAIVATAMLQDPPPPPVTRLAVPPGDGEELVAGDLPTVTVSRDGRQLVYRARRGGRMQLFRRALERPAAEPIAHSEHAVAPFLSPDGDWVGFSRDGALLKVPLAGGSPVVICRTPGAVSAVWLPGGDIVFGGDLTRGLQRVSASGGTPAPLTSLDGDELAHVDPDAWGSGHVSFTIRANERREIGLVALNGGGRRSLGEGAQPRFVAPRHLAFVRQGVLWAAPLDVRRLAFAGAAGPAVEGIDSSVVSGAAHFAVSATGTLVYLPARPAGARARRLIWVDRNGAAQEVPLQPGPYTRAAVSPDGARIALAASSADNRSLWVSTQDSGALTRVTFGTALDTAPVWTPDGSRLIFRSDREGGGLYVVRADGADNPIRLTVSQDTMHTPYEVTRDGRHVLFTEFRTYRDQRIGMVPLDGSSGVTWLVDGAFAELRPRLSPDGRWLAYQSDESGRFEVYVRPFPDTSAGRWQVSTNGGMSPMWGPDGQELFYYQDASVLRVPLAGGSRFAAGAAVPLFSIDVPTDRLGPAYDIAPDGRAFLFVAPPPDAARTGPLMLVEGWSEEVRRQFP